MPFPPKVHTAILPTPLYKMERLTAQVGKANMYIKRDDMTGLAFGGNKLRKLDYIIKHCLDNGYTTVMTHGGQQTNHGRLTAAACAKYGLKCIIVVSGTAPEHMSGNLVLDKILGAEVVFLDMSRFLTENAHRPKEDQIKDYLAIKKGFVKEVVDRYEAQGDKVYDLPVGGHTLEGNLGYVEFVGELLEQQKQMGVNFDYVVTGNGSGGTLAGMVLGAKYFNANFKIIAANIAEKTDAENQHYLDSANETSEKYDLGVKVSLEDLHLSCNDHCGVGYNIPDEKTREVIYRLARTEGIMTDPCYSGKTFSAFLSLVENEVIPKDANAVYVHTGGTPGIYTQEHLLAMEKEIWVENTSFVY